MERFDGLTLDDLREMLRKLLATGPEQRPEDAQFAKQLINEIAQREKRSIERLYIREAMEMLGAARRDEMFGRDSYEDMQLFLKFMDRDNLRPEDIEILQSCKKIAYAVKDDTVDTFYKR